MKKFMVYGGGVILYQTDTRQAAERWIEQDAGQRCDGYYTIFQRVAEYKVESFAVPIVRCGKGGNA